MFKGPPGRPPPPQCKSGAVGNISLYGNGGLGPARAAPPHTATYAITVAGGPTRLHTHPSKPPQRVPTKSITTPRQGPTADGEGVGICDGVHDGNFHRFCRCTYHDRAARGRNSL